MNARWPDSGEHHPAAEPLRQTTQQLAQVVDTVPTGVVITNSDGHILTANAEGERILGLDRVAMVGRTYNDRAWRITACDGGPFPDEDLSFPRVQRTGEAVYAVEHCIERPDGIRVLLSVNAAPCTSADGEFEGMVASISDITDVRHVEESLRRANHALRMLGACGRAVAGSSTEGDLMDAVCRIAVESGGYRLAWIGFAENDDERSVVPVAQAGFEEGYLSTLHITWADTERGRGPTGTAVRTGQPVVSRDVRKDERYAPWREQALRRGYASSMAVPLRDAEGRTFGALNVYAAEPDVFDSDEASVCAQMSDELAFGIIALRAREERRVAEAELAASEERYRATLEEAIEERTRQLHATIATLTEASEAKSRFLENISHELRTPLNAVIGFSDLLLKELAGPLNDEQRRQLNMVHDSGAHLLDLITDVLDLSVIESGAIVMRPEAFSARELTARVLEHAALAAAARGLELTIEDGPDVQVCSDAFRVRQVLLNLLVNAVKFTESGSVTVRVREQDGHAFFDVADTGRGIHSGDLERIFEPFTQVSTTEEGKAAGMGLGLSVSQRLAEILHGSLTVKSELSKGSTFTLAVPLEAPDAPAR